MEKIASNDAIHRINDEKYPCFFIFFFAFVYKNLLKQIKFKKFGIVTFGLRQSILRQKSKRKPILYITLSGFNLLVKNCYNQLKISEKLSFLKIESTNLLYGKKFDYKISALIR